ncbi:uncharacterized protein METZ01_LOCUS363572, partial [marine metagenome]
MIRRQLANKRYIASTRKLVKLLSFVIAIFVIMVAPAYAATCEEIA